MIYYLGKKNASSKKALTVSDVLPLSVISTDKTVLPLRFLNAEKGDEEKGMQRWLDTLKWREDEKIDFMLHQPNYNFHTVKKYVCQYYHKRAKNGAYVYYETPKRTDLVGAKAAGTLTSLPHFISHIS